MHSALLFFTAEMIKSIGWDPLTANKTEHFSRWKKRVNEPFRSLLKEATGLFALEAETHSVHRPFPVWILEL